MKRDLTWIDYITLNFNWFSITTRSQVLSPLIAPLLVQRFIGDAAKGTYLGILRLAALMIALLVQALAGLLSDKSKSKWGRRRPFIVAGVLFEVIFLVAMGFAAGMEGLTGYWAMFGIYIMTMVGSNTSHGATQGLIPDLVTDQKKGLASGIKATLELPVPLIFVSFVIAPLISKGNYWGGLIILIGVLLLGMVISLFIREEPQEGKGKAIDWAPIIRLFVMTILFTLVILFAGWLVKQAISFAQDFGHKLQLTFVGAAGLIGISIAVFLGVLVSVRTGIGAEAKENPSYTWWVVNRLAFLVAAINLSGFMVYFLQERFPQFAGEKAAEPAAQLLMVVGICILLTALPSGWLADRFGKKTLVVFSSLLVGIGTVIVVASPLFSWIILGGVLIGCGVGMFYSANWALGTALVPEGKGGLYLGVSNLAGAGAGAVGAYIGGPIADNVSYVLLMSIYGVMALISILPLMGIKDGE